MSSTGSRIATIDWVDLTTPDPVGALAFYSDLFGWTYESSDTPMGTYHIALAGGHQAAGLMASEPGSPAPPAWTVFVRVSSAAETCSAAVNAGGSVLAEPFEIPGGAKVAVIADPTGAVLAVIAGGPEPAPGEPPLYRRVAGAVSWCELLSRDPHAVVGFYDAVFGWQATLDRTSGYSIFHRDETDVAGLLPMPEEVPPEVPSCWMVYFHVDDVAAAATAAAAIGGSVGKTPTSVGRQTFAVLADGAGATFGILSNDPAAQRDGL